MRIVLALSASLLCGSAFAQSIFATPGGSSVYGYVEMCNNGSGLMVVCTTANPVPVSLAGPLPFGATPITASATGTTASVSATLAGVASKTTYICGFTITSGATLGLGGSATVTGTITGTLNYVQPVSALPAVGQLSQSFAPCVPASAANTGIAINSAAGGVGGNTAVAAWGYQL